MHRILQLLRDSIAQAVEVYPQCRADHAVVGRPNQGSFTAHDRLYLTDQRLEFRFRNLVCPGNQYGVGSFQAPSGFTQKASR